MQLILRNIWISQHFQPHIVEALQSTHTGGSHRNGLGIVSQQSLDGMTMHGDILRMHGMLTNRTALHGAERSGTDMQGDFFAFNTMRINITQYPFRKMQPCRRSSHAAFNLGIYRLIGRLVALLCLAVQVGRDGQFTQHIENVGKVDVGIVPLELNELAGSLLALANC